MIDKRQLCRLVVRECLQPVSDDLRGDPEFFCQFVDTGCPGGVLAECFYGDESARGFGADCVFENGLLAAAVSTLNVDELVGQCAAACVLLEPGPTL